jgi:bacterial/archaeal transporter family protein
MQDDKRTAVPGNARYVFCSSLPGNSLLGYRRGLFRTEFPMWMTLALLSAVLLGFYDVSKKHAVQGNAVIPVLFTSTAAGFLVLLPLFIFTQPASLPVRGHVLLGLKALLVGLSWVLAYAAMKHLPITIASPVRASQPVWTLAGAILLFAEHPTAFQWAGIVLITVSYYVLMLAGRREGIRFHANRWVFYMFAATLLGAASALYDKWLLQRAGFAPFTVQFWFAFYLVVFTAVLLVADKRLERTTTPFAWRWTAPLTGVLLVASDFLYFHALAQPDVMISLVSPLRRSGAAIAFVAGGLLFREQNRRRKALALAGILAGIALIAWKK